jgi:peptide/nickel transport system substrate-binding protein
MRNQIWRVLVPFAAITAFILAGCTSLNMSQNESASFIPMRVEAADCNYGGEVKAVEAVDAFTVKFTLCSSDVAFPAKMASPVMVIQDKDFLDANKGDSASMSTTVNGTGAFRVKDQAPGQPLQLRASTSHWGTPPKPTDVLVDWYTNPTGLLSSYEMTIVDVASSLSSPASSALKSNPTFLPIEHQPFNLIYLGFNNSIQPVSNVVVRQALAALIDRDKLVKSYFPIGSLVANQLIPSGVNPGYSKLIQWYEVRPKDALDSLKAANFDFNQTLTLTYVIDPTDFLNSYAGIAGDIKQQLASFGITVNLKPLSKTDFTQAMANGTEMMFLDGYQALYADGASFYEIPFVRQTAKFGSPYADLQQALQLVLAEQTISLRQAKFDALNKNFLDDVPLIPIGRVVESSFVRTGVSNAFANTYYENYEDMSNLAHTIQILEKTRPLSLWPADETDFDTFRVTRLLYDNLVENGFGTDQLQPALADSWKTNATATEWTFYLRYNIKFSNGAAFDANDVVASFAAVWDASSANHTGRTGEFTVFKQLFGGFINAK